MESTITAQSNNLTKHSIKQKQTFSTHKLKTILARTKKFPLLNTRERSNNRGKWNLSVCSRITRWTSLVTSTDWALVA